MGVMQKISRRIRFLWSSTRPPYLLTSVSFQLKLLIPFLYGRWILVQKGSFGSLITELVIILAIKVAISAPVVAVISLWSGYMYGAAYSQPHSHPVSADL